MELEGKNVLVVGLGRTGEALCTFLVRRGAQVTVSEKEPEEKLGDRVTFWRRQGVNVETGGHRLSSFVEANLIIPSPGVSYIPQLEEARRRGVFIFSEVELAFRFLRGRIVGITGSNGKSTTAVLTHKILQDAGLPAQLAGNIGAPLIRFAETSREEDIYVTELSSFQLRYTERFRSAVSVFLNFSPDHLDWHPDLEDYFASKKNLLRGQKAEDTAVLNRDDPRVWSLRSMGSFRVCAFSREARVSPGCWIQEGWMRLAVEKEEKLLPLEEIPLLGPHNQENVMASALVGAIFGVPPSQIRESVRAFKGLEHRLERVLSIGRVTFYNDSKATNIDATLKSVQSFEEPVVLILGGRDKGGDFAPLKEPVRRRAKAVILIGEAQEKIARALGGAAPMIRASGMKDAVRRGYTKAFPEGVVLLAPACTSFDMFENFEQRGSAFKKEVFSLKEEVEHEA